jgi:pyruvate dehydrogenase E1 component
VLKAQALLENMASAADVVERDELTTSSIATAHRVERVEPAQSYAAAKVPYVAATWTSAERRLARGGASDYLKSQPDMISRWVGRPMVTLGTDGFGRSEDRAVAARLLRGRRARHVAGADAFVALQPARTKVDAKVVR